MYNLLKEMELRGLKLRHTNGSVYSIQACIDKHDERERDRTKMAKDLNTPHFRIDTHRPIRVIICTRNSVAPSARAQMRQQSVRDTIEQTLRSGQVIPELRGASYTQINRNRTSLAADFSNARMKDLQLAVMQMQDDTQVVMVSVDVDGFSCNEEV